MSGLRKHQRLLTALLSACVLRGRKVECIIGESRDVPVLTEESGESG